MPRAVRDQTDYKGVSYIEKNDERIFNITYRRPESRKLYEENVLELLRSIINFGARKKLCPAPEDAITKN